MDPEGLYLTRQLIRQFLLPPNGLLLLVLVGAIMAGWSRRHYRLGAVMSIASLFIFYLLMTPAVSQKLMAGVERGVGDSLDETSARAMMRGAGAPQAIVLLGGGSMYDVREQPRPDMPSGYSLGRLVHAAQLAKWTALPVLASGGNPSGQSESDATIMARSMLDLFGVPVRWIEDDSLDTASNASLTAPILKTAGISRVLLVTDAFHMARARKEFEAIGLQVIPAPHRWRSQRGLPLANTWIPTSETAARSTLAIHEIIGYGWYALRRAFAD